MTPVAVTTTFYYLALAAAATTAQNWAQCVEHLEHAARAANVSLAPTKRFVPPEVSELRAHLIDAMHDVNTRNFALLPSAIREALHCARAFLPAAPARAA